MTAESSLVAVSAATSFRVESVTEIDAWLDGEVAATYRGQPLAQDWARVAKVTEEAGEAIEALIAWTGQNPRKPQRPEARAELLTELADVALTAILAIQHFTKDAGQTWAHLDHRLGRLHERAQKATTS
jgi:photosystem II stability/assembly factor-like uncharacterized protein